MGEGGEGDEGSSRGGDGGGPGRGRGGGVGGRGRGGGGDGEVHLVLGDFAQNLGHKVRNRGHRRGRRRGADHVGHMAVVQTSQDAYEVVDDHLRLLVVLPGIREVDTDGVGKILVEGRGRVESHLGGLISP